MYSVDDLQAVNQLCADRGIYHISDEAYENFVYDSVTHYSPAQFDRNSRHTISLFSLSKAYGFAGWRMGYMVIPEALQRAIQKIQDTVLICPPVVSQVAAEAAIGVGSAYPRQFLGSLNQARELMLDRLQTLGDLCQVVRPSGAFYTFIKVPGKRSSLELVKLLITTAKVAVIPGVAFGCDDCYLRIAYGALDPQQVEAGVNRLVMGLREILT